MKKFIIVFLCLLTFIKLNAQSKITGFGKLQLNDPISIIDGMGFTLDTISSNGEYFKYAYKKTNFTKIYEFVVDSTEKYQLSQASYDKRVRVFIVPKIAITDNMVIESVNLKFFNDSLIQIHCDNKVNVITDALTLKYGAPEIKTEEEEKYFTNYLGNTITKIDVTYTSNWKTIDNNISCSSVMSTYHDDKGEVNYIQFVTLSNISFNDEIRETEKEIKKGIKERELKQKKDSLKGF